MFDALQNKNLETYKVVRLVADGCGGQNKNSTLLAMASKWLALAPENIERVEIVFPVTGHSYIPPDRVFGLVEKEIKKKEVILNPEEYTELFSRYATVKHLGSDCLNLDWKAAKDEVIKPPGSWHFQFKATKRFYLYRGKNKKITVQGEAFYRNSFCNPQTICKRGKAVININPEIILKKNTIKREKKENVEFLLTKHYGNDWRMNPNLKMDFYKYVIDNIDNDDNADGGEEDPQCETQEENHEFKV